MRGAIAEGYPARLSSERVLAEMEYMMAEPGLSDMLGRMERSGYGVPFLAEALFPLWPIKGWEG